MAKPKVNIALIGGGFMGRTHSNGYHQARTFFDLPMEPVKKVICDRELENAQKLAERFNAMILHAENSDAHVYYVQGEGTTYRFVMNSQKTESTVPADEAKN